jgi:hypothetical protein
LVLPVASFAIEIWDKSVVCGCKEDNCDGIGEESYVIGRGYIIAAWKVKL